jgi:hypothetical protein
MSISTDTTTGKPSPEAEATVDCLNLDEIGRLADPASSYWRSVSLAANRADALTVVTRCRQVARVTREALLLAAEPDQGIGKVKDATRRGIRLASRRSSKTRASGYAHVQVEQ